MSATALVIDVRKMKSSSIELAPRSKRPSVVGNPGRPSS
jgi:hypothetical protein